MSDYNPFFFPLHLIRRFFFFIPAVLWDLDLGQGRRTVTVLMIRRLDADIFPNPGNCLLVPKE